MKHAAVILSILICLYTAGCAGEKRHSEPVYPSGEAEAVTVFIPKEKEITLFTEPGGGMIRIPEKGVSLDSGESILLSEGDSYTLVAEKQGYESASATLEITHNTQPYFRVPLGKGFARVKFSVFPEDVQIRLKESGQIIAPSKSVKLYEGRYTAVFHGKGYAPLEKSFSVVAGKPVVMDVELQKILPHIQETEIEAEQAQAKVIAEPSDSIIFFRQQEVGTGSADLGLLEYGSYHVRVVKMLDAWNRLTGEKEFSVNSRKPLDIRVAANRQESLFEGQWLVKDMARMKETERYNRLKTQNCVQVVVNASRDSLPFSGIPDEFAAKLHSIMRAGDRILFTYKGAKWLVWKRNTTMTHEFKSSVFSFLKQETYTCPWKPSPCKSTNIDTIRKKEFFTQIALSLYSQLTPYPLIFMKKSQLVDTGETISRCRADGNIFLLALGGKGFQADGGTRRFSNNGLKIFYFQPSDHPIRCTWEISPDMLLCTGSKLENLSIDFHNATTLKSGEKRIVRFPIKENVRKMIRFSRGPDYQDRWERKEFLKTGPMHSMLDLNKEQIGPQVLHGEYLREWILYFYRNGVPSQRHIFSTYRVSDKKQQYSSNYFFGHLDIESPDDTDKNRMIQSQ